MPKITIAIPHLREAVGQLKKARVEIVEPVQVALLECADLVRDAAERNAPIGETGNLRRAFRSAKGRAQRNFLQAFTFTLSQIAKHAHLVEYGTKPHSIIPKRSGGILAFGKYFARQVDHPGSKASQFFRRAVRSSRNRVKRTISDAVAKAINQMNAQAN